MKYSIKVVIYNPDTQKGMNSDIYLDLTAEFEYNPKQYGNGHYVCIKGDGFTKESYDIRYDRSFNRNRIEQWLEEWAHWYWSGKNGAYAVKSIKVAKI